MQDDTVQKAFARADGVEKAHKRAVMLRTRTYCQRFDVSWSSRSSSKRALGDDDRQLYKYRVLR